MKTGISLGKCWPSESMVIANLYLSFSAHLNPIRKAFPFPLFLDKLISLRLFS